MQWLKVGHSENLTPRTQSENYSTRPNARLTSQVKLRVVLQGTNRLLQLKISTLMSSDYVVLCFPIIIFFFLSHNGRIRAAATKTLLFKAHLFIVSLDNVSLEWYAVISYFFKVVNLQPCLASLSVITCSRSGKQNKIRTANFRNFGFSSLK